ncbi:hypothetical protein V9T40_010632 [Parthenolecanium corni]|uniref:Phosphodiesterase n=1 Tax=Parthenolecanium corni TaxID=536013 RepID=A0AAN9T5J9_9HEMI
MRPIKETIDLSNRGGGLIRRRGSVLERERRAMGRAEGATQNVDNFVNSRTNFELESQLRNHECKYDGRRAEWVLDLELDRDEDEAIFCHHPSAIAATRRDDHMIAKAQIRHENRRAKQGSLTIVRRSSTKKSPAGRYIRRGASVNVIDDEALDEIDLNTDNLPAVDTPDACDKAALRLRCLLRQLQKGEVSATLLQRNLRYAAKVLEAVFIDETNDDESIKFRRESLFAGLSSGTIVTQFRKCVRGHGDGGAGGSGVNLVFEDVGGCFISMVAQTESDEARAEYTSTSSQRTRTLASKNHLPVNRFPIGSPFGRNLNFRNTELGLQCASDQDGLNQCDGHPKLSSQTAPLLHSSQQRRRLRTPIWARRLVDEDDELSLVQPDAVPPEVREWLASTFTRQLATSRRKTDEKPKFRSVAHAIRAGIFVDRMYRRVTSATIMQFPDDVVRVLKTLDEWSFDIFDLSNASSNQPLKYLGYDLLNRYGMFHKFKVPPPTVEYFLTKIEEGYCRYVNPYHNNLHAADVAQSIHWMLLQTGLMHWLTDLEIFATLVAAIVHDYEHTGTTNNFHVMSGSDKALLYNDRAVLENHHISATFRLIKEDDCNILQHLSREEYREFRTLVIDMVLATDMSFHFQQLKNMRNLLTIAEPFMDKSKALSLVLHCCDISHPAKRWDLHHQWTERLLEEFFRQGDEERKLGLPFSPLCDRNNTLVAESQIGFIDFIVEPSMTVCGDMLEVIACVVSGPPTQMADSVCRAETQNAVETSVCGSENARIKFKKPWIACLAENKRKWKEQAAKECEARESNAAEVGEESADGSRTAADRRTAREER